MGFQRNFWSDNFVERIRLKLVWLKWDMRLLISDSNVKLIVIINKWHEHQIECKNVHKIEIVPRKNTDVESSKKNHAI